MMPLVAIRASVREVLPWSFEQSEIGMRGRGYLWTYDVGQYTYLLYISYELISTGAAVSG